MARTLKHVGQLINTQRRVVVVFREIPGEPEKCLVVDTDALVDWMHDDVINAVESAGAQAAANFYEYAGRAVFTDGSNMLQALHKRNLLQKQPTTNVMMVPNPNSRIRLDELNTIIAEQTGGKPAVTPDKTQMEMAKKQTNDVSDPAIKASQDTVIGDDDIAKGMLAQAEQFEAEAKRLRDEAFEMAPSLKPKRGRKANTTQTA